MNAPTPPGEGEALQARVAALRLDPGAPRDPARLAYLEALARRLAGQPAPVRRLLQQRLEAALAQPAAPVAPAPPAKARASAAGAPLARLNEYLRTAAGRHGAAGPGAAEDPEELASVRRFRQSWEHGRTLERVEQAVARKPANAGPLNSHMLVLQALDLLRELSPEYLRSFVSQVEALQWLEQARAKPPRTAAKTAAARRARSKPPAPRG